MVLGEPDDQLVRLVFLAAQRADQLHETAAGKEIALERRQPRREGGVGAEFGGLGNEDDADERRGEGGLGAQGRLADLLCLQERRLAADEGKQPLAEGRHAARGQEPEDDRPPHRLPSQRGQHEEDAARGQGQDGRAALGGPIAPRQDRGQGEHGQHPERGQDGTGGNAKGVEGRDEREQRVGERPDVHAEEQDQGHARSQA